MTSEDDHSGDDSHRTAPARLGKSSRSRPRVVAGAAGLAAALGIGAYLTTSAIVSDDVPVAEEVRPIAPTSKPLASAGASPPAPDGSAATRSSPPPGQVSAPDEQATTATQQEKDPDEVRKEIVAARKEAERHGFPVQRPLEQTAGGATGSETTQTLPGGGTMRITTAKGDLAGQRPMMWAADGGEALGPNRCTQSFRFSEGENGVERPTMLLCWRTSASRSVAVLSVTPEGTPSAGDSAAVIDREWKKLG
jgi:hypothetical protein